MNIQEIDEKYLKELEECTAKALDAEDAHLSADDVLVRALREAGCVKLAEAFNDKSQRFWYA